MPKKGKKSKRKAKHNNHETTSKDIAGKSNSAECEANDRDVPGTEKENQMANVENAPETSKLSGGTISGVKIGNSEVSHVTLGNESTCYIGSNTVHHHHHPFGDVHSAESKTHGDKVDESEGKKGIRKAFKIIEDYLRNHHSGVGSWIPRLPFLDKDPLENFYVDLELQTKDPTGRYVKKESIQYEDIFKAELGQRPPKRIVIVGNAGCGKTTMVTKLARDWAVQVNGNFDQFKAVLIVRLRILQNHTNLEDIVTDQFRQVLQDSRCLADPTVVLEELLEKTLILLDGYDEISMEEQKSVKNFLTCPYFSSATVVTTTRPRESDKYFLSIFNRYVAICELSDFSRGKLIDLVFAEHVEEAKLFKMQLKNMPIASLSPLLLYTFCFVFQNSDHKNYVNRTDLVLKACRILLERAFAKRKLQTSEEEMTGIILSLGKYFWGKLIQSSYEFPYEELLLAFGESCEHVIKMGVLQPKTEDLYVPIHARFMDYLAWNFLFTHQESPSEDRISFLDPHGWMFQTTSVSFDLHGTDDEEKLFLTIDGPSSSISSYVTRKQSFSEAYVSTQGKAYTNQDCMVNIKYNESSEEFYSLVNVKILLSSHSIESDFGVKFKLFSATIQEDGNLRLVPEKEFSSEYSFDKRISLVVNKVSGATIEKHEETTWQELEKNVPLFHSVLDRIITEKSIIYQYCIITVERSIHGNPEQYVKYLHQMYNPDTGQTCFGVRN